MTKFIFIVATFFNPILSFADGFRCLGMSSGLEFKLYHKVDRASGTRTPQILIISNRQVQLGSQTVATFSYDQGVLSYSGYGHYIAKVDHRLAQIRDGEEIAGTNLRALKTINVKINFAYSPFYAEVASIANSIGGQVEYIEQNGDVLTEDLDCVRYLKLQL